MEEAAVILGKEYLGGRHCIGLVITDSVVRRLRATTWRLLVHVDRRRNLGRIVDESEVVWLIAIGWVS